MRFLLCVTVAFFSSGARVRCTDDQERCIDYYKTGVAFDLNDFDDANYTAVYTWPPDSRKTDCREISFRKIAKSDTLRNACDNATIDDDVVMQAEYTNVAGKLTRVLYYGNGEVKTVRKSCERVFKYIFIRINGDYVLGINCSAGGRGVLLAKRLDNLAEVQTIVDGVEIMSGREGSVSCKLA